MMHHSGLTVPTLVLCVAVAFAASCSRTQYVDAGGSDLIVSPDRMNLQDWSLLADQAVQDMVVSGSLSRYSSSSPPGLLLNPLKNQTGEQFDGDAILKKIRIALLATGRVQVITAGDASQSGEDALAQRAKSKRQLSAGLADPLADVPGLTIQAKLLADRVKASGQTQTAYLLQLTLTDTTSGRGVWEGEAKVVKRGASARVGY